MHTVINWFDQNVFPRIITIVSSQRFVYATLVLFALQAIFFSFSIAIGERYRDDTGQVVYDFAVAPDEVRHFGNIRYYADRPIFASPFIDQSEVVEDDLWLGEVTRFP